MDIVDFWSRQVAKWNDENKCGMCWEFSAPLIESAVELIEDEGCCTQVILLRDKLPAFSTSNTYSNQTFLLNGVTCSKSFELLVLMYADIGTNNWNEVKGHNTEESKWSTIFSRLEECLACDAELDFCEFIGVKSRVTTWSARQVLNYSSKNFSGFRITVTFQNIK